MIRRQLERARSPGSGAGSLLRCMQRKRSRLRDSALNRNAPCAGKLRQVPRGRLPLLQLPPVDNLLPARGQGPQFIRNRRGLGNSRVLEFAGKMQFLLATVTSSSDFFAAFTA